MSLVNLGRFESDRIELSERSRASTESWKDDAQVAGMFSMRTCIVAS